MQSSLHFIAYYAHKNSESVIKWGEKKSVPPYESNVHKGSTNINHNDLGNDIFSSFKWTQSPKLPLVSKKFKPRISVVLQQN